MSISEQTLNQLHAANDETAEAAQEIKSQFHEMVEILDHERWGCFGDGFTRVNYSGQLEQHVRGLQ